MLKYGSITRMSSWPGKDAPGRFMTPTISNLWPLTSIHLPIGIFAVHQRARDIGADHGHRHAMLVFRVGEKAPFLHLGLAALRHRILRCPEMSAL